MSLYTLENDHDDYFDKQDHPRSSTRPFLEPSLTGIRLAPSVCLSSHPQRPSMGMTTEEQSRFRVIIVGGNIAGLMLGCFLQLAGIDYVILEKELRDGLPRKPLVLGSFVMNLLEKVGLAEETMASSSQMMVMNFWKATASECEYLGRIDFSQAEARYAYNGRVIEYAELQRILLSNIPPGCLLDKQEVVHFTQTADQVDVQCSDGTIYTGSILVGADGYDSTIRRLLYEELARQPPDLLDDSDEGLLPPSDREPLSTSCCISGTTHDLDLQEELFPELNSINSEMLKSHVIQGAEVPFCWWMTHHPRTRKISWLITYDRLRDTTAWQSAHPSRDDLHREDLVQDFFAHMRPLRTPFGGTGTLGDLMDQTDPQTIQRFKKCAKTFETWYHHRVVLMGDACHKLVPYAGQGALQAMVDACQLSLAIKRIYDSVEPPALALETEFGYYRADRYINTEQAVQHSLQFSEFVGHPDFNANLLGLAQFDLAPDWLVQLSQDNASLHESQ